MASDDLVTLRVWGEFACFTRPEMKVERVSYPVMTPSAARGILEAIFWEPQMYYLIDSIRVVKRGRWVSFRRNEVTRGVSLDSVGTWMKSPEEFAPIEAGGGAGDGTQRNTLALEDVDYLISAEMRLTELGREEGQSLRKYRDEMERRTCQGKCYHRPALGLREFAANFEWVGDPSSLPLADWPEEDLGLMLYDVFDPRERARGFRWLSDEELVGNPEESARYRGSAVKPQAAFFQAVMRDARLECHPERVELMCPMTAEEGR